MFSSLFGRPTTDEGESLEKAKPKRSLRPIAFAATAFCTASLTSCLIAFPLILHYIQVMESGVQLDLDFCRVCRFSSEITHKGTISSRIRFQFRARDMWKEMFEIRTNGKREEAVRLANMMINRRRLEKRDTLGDFWSRRLHDMQLRDDPVESGYGSSRKASDAYGAASSQPKGGAEYGGGGTTPGTTRPAPTSAYSRHESGYGGATPGGRSDYGGGTPAPASHGKYDQETPSTGCCTCQRGPPGKNFTRFRH